jgi:acyl carrier protein
MLPLIYEAIDELNETLDEPIEKSDSTQLFGSKSKLDSMGLVSLIVTVERLIDEKYGKTVTLASEKAFSRSSSPFRTVQTLSEYISELLAEEN